MSQYEITFLLNEEAELPKLKELLKSHKGEFMKENDWGIKQLGYPIKKMTSAHYFNWVFKMDVSDVREFKRVLNFNDKIIRYLILKVDNSE